MEAAVGVNLKSGFCVRSFGCQIRRFQLDIPMGAFPRHRTCPFQNKSSQAEPFTEFYFPPILVFQNISLGNSNACKCNDWSGPPLILFPLCVLKASKVNHMVGFALSQEIMGSYSSLCRLSKFHTKGRKLHVPPAGKV